MSEPEKKPRVLDNCIDILPNRLALRNERELVVVIAGILKVPVLDCRREIFAVFGSVKFVRRSFLP